MKYRTVFDALDSYGDDDRDLSDEARQRWDAMSEAERAEEIAALELDEYETAAIARMDSDEIRNFIR